ncbi:MAG: hypothetical protein K8R23_01740 [Chthoniobacter sp.]|nr:hypothetical protein [Chthoniobacter sp.]
MKIRSKSLRLCQITALLLALLAPEIAAAQAPANQGTLNVNGRRLNYKSVVAVRVKSDDGTRIVVLATMQPVSAEVLKKVKDKDAEDNVDSEVDAAYLKAIFREDGSPTGLIGRGNNTSFTKSGNPLEAKATIADGRIRGSAKLIETGDFGKEVTLDFDVPIDAEVKAPAPEKLDPPVKPTVAGKFDGNGKPGRIQFVLVEEHEPFNDKEAIRLIFTEKDPATSKRPSFDAAFGKLGSALILSVHRVDGEIFGCEVAHSAHTKKGFTSLGVIQMVEFEVVGGNVKGQVSTGKVLDTFGEKWDVDLKFAAPLPEKLRNAPAPKPKPAPNEQRETEKKEPKAPAGPMIDARKLALPKDATDVDYKELVKHIQFSSAQGVAAVAKDFSAQLKQQGWKESGRDLIGKPNAILKRELGDAKLTIMISPGGAGSVVKIFTEGLDWSGEDDAPPAAKTKPVTEDDNDGDNIEQQAEKLLKDALKKLPKGL